MIYINMDKYDIYIYIFIYIYIYIYYSFIYTCTGARQYFSDTLKKVFQCGY